MTFFNKLMGALLLVASSTGWAATSAEADIDGIAAIVNDDIITLRQLDKQVEFVKKQLSAQNPKLPPMAILRKQVLEREIVKQIQLQLARNTGILVDDNALNTTIENIAGQNKMNLREFRNALESDGFNFADYREFIRDEIIINKLRQREVSNLITVTEQEVDNFLATQQIQGDSDDEYLLSHILISVPEAANSETIEAKQKKAASILADLRKGVDFAQTAMSVSNGPQALEGGSLGWRKAGQLPTLFARIIPQMKVGQVSDIIRNPTGFHIVKLVDKKASKQHVVTQTKARHILLKSNELSAEAEIITRLRQLKDRIESGESFDELARSHSEDRVSAGKGGDLDWVSPGDLTPQFEDVMNRLQPNQVSEPFQTPFGWHIVQVLERRTLDDSGELERKQAKEFIRMRKMDEMTENWMRQLRDEAFVDVKAAF